MGDISDSYAQVGKLCMRNQEALVNYIDSAQIVHNRIIEDGGGTREDLLQI